MARDAQELVQLLTSATDAGFRSRLLARGQAQSMIRRDGILPADAPAFSAYLDADLLHYGYALLSLSLELLEITGSESAEQVALAQLGFIQSSYALEAATRNAISADLAFHGLVAGAASHLGGFAARAFSLIQKSRDSERLTPMEETLADLIMRDLGSIERRTLLLRTSDQVADGALVAAFDRIANGADDETPPDEIGPVVLLLSENYLSAVAAGLFAIQLGDRELLETALAELREGEQASSDASAPGPWWVYRLTRYLMGGLFDTSLETNIPRDPPPGADDFIKRWRRLRRTFVASLLARERAEIDLWPSQLHVVDRLFRDGRDLVVALPTSAGKTRIAELSILACLAQQRRTVYVTPLRALSAQTEHILARTFTPLGVRVSSLYGSMGTSEVDEDTLRSSEIVVATPEKLDFALRSDPSLLDDVGLIVLDEGHMIGSSEREVRYEAQIQRLLRRDDASERRILCLSAVFPSGSELDDFVAWITDDDADGLHRESWRPTQLRFGLVEWRRDHARLTVTLGTEQPFIEPYFEETKPSGKRKRMFPSDQREHVIATGWRLVEEGQSVLVFCPLRKSVEPFASTIVDLHARGLVTSLLPPDVDLDNALAVGSEWFGADHPILKCLKLGVAIHHGALPGPFRREIEHLLRRGALKVTIASPTLAQGLNLSASAVLFHGLHRGRELIKSSEFANVIGRAGRAFIDTEGLVLYPIFDSRAAGRSRSEWIQLTEGDGGKDLQSGLIEISIALLRRMYTAYGLSAVEPLINYLTGAPDWSLPVIAHEAGGDQVAAAESWRENLKLLDIAILSIVGDGDQDVVADAATQIVANALRDSLWDRQLRHSGGVSATAVRELVYGRTRHLWQTATPSQRRGWFLAGLGAEGGSQLSQVSGHIVALIGQAETAIFAEDDAAATDLIVLIANAIFGVETFQPKTNLDNWEDVLRQWVCGGPLVEIPGDRVETAQFIEDDVIYRLIWGMEAAKVYEVAQGNVDAESLSGSVHAAIETGTFNLPVSILIRAGFDHRLAAISAVESTDAAFSSMAEMRGWIDSLGPEHALNPAWPTPETRSAWELFANPSRTRRGRRWHRQTLDVPDVTWRGTVPESGTWLRITDGSAGTIKIWSTGFELMGEASIDLDRERQGVLYARRHRAHFGVRLDYRGPGDLLPE